MHFFDQRQMLFFLRNPQTRIQPLELHTTICRELGNIPFTAVCHQMMPPFPLEF